MKRVLFLLLILFLTYSCGSKKKIVKNEVNEKEIKIVDSKNKKEYKDVPFSIIEKSPIFPGCENFETERERRNCFKEMMRKHIIRYFDPEIASCVEKEKVYNKESDTYEEVCVGLSRGKKRIYIKFKIGKTGEIEDISVRAPHNRLKIEAIRLAKKLPKMTPGKQEGKPVNVPYILPITFNVE